MLETSTQEVTLLEFLLRRALLVITCIEWSLNSERPEWWGAFYA